MLTPARRRGFELLDDPAVDPAIRERSHRDITIANTLLGGARAVLAEFRSLLPALGTSASLLDVGTGLGDIPQKAHALARRHGVSLRTFGFDGAESLARSAARTLDAGICGDARRLPFADGSVDIVICSQVLHHFEDDDITGILGELDRVARVAVIVGDLRRSWLAAAGFWLVAWPFGFHPVTRHDGTTSVLRGFTARELADSVARSTSHTARVRRHLGYRLTATWTPAS